MLACKVVAAKRFVFDTIGIASRTQQAKNAIPDSKSTGIHNISDSKTAPNVHITCPIKKSKKTALDVHITSTTNKTKTEMICQVFPI